MERYGYGKRWWYEIAFSAVKRIFGGVRDGGKYPMFEEVESKSIRYNGLLGT